VKSRVSHRNNENQKVGIFCPFYRQIGNFHDNDPCHS